MVCTNAAVSAKGGHRRLDAGVEGGEVGIQGVDQGQMLLEEEGVVRGQPAFDRLAKRGLLLPDRPLRARRQLLGVIQAGTQGLEDRAAGLPHDVGDDAAQLDVGQLQRLRDPIDVVAPLADERFAQAGQVAEIPHGSGRDEAPPQQATFEQLRQPLTIPHIGLAARQHLHVPRVHQLHLHRALQDGKHRPPVHPRGFHRHVRDPVGRQPGGQGLQSPQRGREGLGLRVPRVGPRARPPHTRHHRRLVHVETRTPGIDEVHGRRLSGGSGALIQGRVS